MEPFVTILADFTGQMPFCHSTICVKSLKVAFIAENIHSRN